MAIKKSQINEQINRIVGYSLIPCWECFTVNELKEVLTELLKGKVPHVFGDTVHKMYPIAKYTV